MNFTLYIVKHTTFLKGHMCSICYKFYCNTSYTPKITEMRLDYIITHMPIIDKTTLCL